MCSFYCKNLPKTIEALNLKRHILKWNRRDGGRDFNFICYKYNLNSRRQTDKLSFVSICWKFLISLLDLSNFYYRLMKSGDWVLMGAINGKVNVNKRFDGKVFC